MNKLISIFIVVLLAIGCGSETNANLSIWEAAEQGNIAVLQEHINGGVDVNVKGARTWMEATPLHHAVKGGQLDMIPHLINQGANVNALGRETPVGGNVTPLDISVKDENGNPDILELLRKHGAKLSLELVDE